MIVHANARAVREAGDGSFGMTAMTGFRQAFQTPEACIHGITYEIWKAGGIFLIESDYYAAECAVYKPLGVTRTAAEVTTGTRATLQEFPDRSLLPSTSSRVAIRWTYAGRHVGQGRYGSPTFLPPALLDISHFQFHSDPIKAKWMLAADLSVYAQIGGARS